MRKHIGMIVLGILVAAGLLSWTAACRVDELTDIVLVQTFGRVTDVRRGSEKGQAGLMLKWPFPIQKIVRYDSRARVFEDTHTEVATGDKQNMLVTVYCAWRIQDPEKFYRTIEQVDAAQERVRNLVRSCKKDVVGKHNMEDFVNTDPAKMKIPQIETEIFDLVRKQAQDDYGVEVVMVGLKTLALPEQVTTAVIDAMKEERQREVRNFESAGEAQATAITERAKTSRDQILKFADRKAAEIRAEGDLAAARYYKEFESDPELAMFLRSLESLRKELKGRSVILLDGSVLPAVTWLNKQPTRGDLKKIVSATTRPATMPADPEGMR